MPIAVATRRASCRSSSEQQLPNDVCPSRLVVQLHRQADDLVALLGEQRGGHRRIHAARHRDNDLHGFGQSSSARGVMSTGAGAAPPRVRLRSFSTSRGSVSTTRSTSASVENDTEAEAERVLRPMHGKAHGLQHVRRLQRARRAGRTGRHRDALEVQRDQQALGLDPIEADIGRVRHARRRRRR